MAKVQNATQPSKTALVKALEGTVAALKRFRTFEMCPEQRDQLAAGIAALAANENATDGERPDSSEAGEIPGTAG